MKKIVLALIIFLSVGKTIGQTKYSDVAPIFYNRCTGCHNQISHGTPLLNYSQIQPQLSNIQAYLTSGYMPPWTADTTYMRFIHERHVTTAEKNAILNWIANGAEKGDTTLIPPPPVYSRYQINATPDLELTIPTFTSNASTTDSHVYFSLPTGLTQDRVIQALEVVAGNPSIVHHIIVNVDTTGTVTSNLAGNCFTAPGNFSIGGYAPRAEPCIFPNKPNCKMGIRLKAGSNIILQIHYPSGTVGQVDSTKIRLYFYPVGATNIRQIHAKTFLINNSLNIPANTVQTFTAQYMVQNAMSIFSAFPHSHYLAKSILNYAYSANDTIPLIRINKWDFDFQGFYTFRKMVKVSAGYKLFASHVFDNTSNNPDNPNKPPINVLSGTSSSDEMMHDAFQWVDYKAGDEFLNIDSLLANDPLVNSINQNKTGNDFKAYAFPNPFENEVSIGYELNNPVKVSIEIYAVLGANVRMLKNNFEVAGLHEVIWDGKNNEGVSLAAGTYFYIIKAGYNQSYGKLTLLTEKK
jgi:hypothetical protein